MGTVKLPASFAVISKVAASVCYHLCFSDAAACESSLFISVSNSSLTFLLVSRIKTHCFIKLYFVTVIILVYHGFSYWDDMICSLYVPKEFLPHRDRLCPKQARAQWKCAQSVVESSSSGGNKVMGKILAVTKKRLLELGICKNFILSKTYK